MSMIAVETRVTSEKRTTIRTRTYIGASPEDVLELMRRERFTGRVIVDMSQGGICIVQAEDRSNIPT